MPSTILITDYHPGFRAQLRRWLCASFPMCHILEATSGEETLSVAEVEPPDIVLMEIKLPRMSGLETAQKLKIRFPWTHVVILTFGEELEYRIAASAVGAKACMAKYNLGRELLPVVSTLLDELCCGTMRRPCCNIGTYRGQELG